MYSDARMIITITNHPNAGEEGDRDSERDRDRDRDAFGEDFSSMNLKEDVLKGIYSFGLEFPTRLQQIVLKPLALQRRNAVISGPIGMIDLFVILLS